MSWNSRAPSCAILESGAGDRKGVFPDAAPIGSSIAASIAPAALARWMAILTGGIRPSGVRRHVSAGLGRAAAARPVGPQIVKDQRLSTGPWQPALPVSLKLAASLAGASGLFIADS